MIVDEFGHRRHSEVSLDFIVTRQGRPEWAIQVSWSLAQGVTEERELRSLAEFLGDNEACRGLVITYNETTTRVVGSPPLHSVQIIPAWWWTLEFTLP